MPFCKTVIINRAVPGSGKTSISRCVINALRSSGLSVACQSTDDFFMIDGRYCFDKNKLFEYHTLNLNNFISDLKSGVDIVICDNTNILPWEAKPYTDSARKYNYQIVFMNFTPRELYKHVAAQQITPEKPDAHCVPEDVLIKFIDDFNNYNSLLDKNAEVKPSSQFSYKWDVVLGAPVQIGTAMPFDYDILVTIEPHEYHDAKKTIGDRLLELVYKTA